MDDDEEDPEEEGLLDLELENDDSMQVVSIIAHYQTFAVLNVYVG